MTKFVEFQSFFFELANNLLTLVGYFINKLVYGG